ncbi:MAG: LuxR C-terminal-related transcriptional regulator [Acidimicrobiia bacterium]
MGSIPLIVGTAKMAPRSEGSYRGGATDTEQPVPAENGEIRVFLVDDHELFLDALARRLEVEPTIALVGRATNVTEARRAIGRVAVDVLVVDAQLDNESGIELVGQALRDRMAPAAVVVTAHDNVELAAQAVRSGARGFVTKVDHIDELVETVSAVHRGETRLPNRLLAGILEELQRASREDDELVRRLEMLTDREREVLAMLASGADRQAIARSLFISAHTVRTHVQRILTKLNVHSQLEAVSVALRAGLQHEPPG